MPWSCVTTGALTSPWLAGEIGFLGYPIASRRPPSTRQLLYCWTNSVGLATVCANGYRSGRMGRTVDVDELVPTKVVAERLGFKGPQAIHYYLRSDPTFPKPLFEQPDAAHPFRLWYWPDIEAWWAVRRRRPPKADPAEQELARDRLADDSPGSDP